MDVWKEYFGSILGWLVKKFFAVAGQSVLDGAAGGLYLAASEDIIEGGDGIRGEYFIPIAERCETSEIAGDMELAEELWVSIFLFTFMQHNLQWCHGHNFLTESPSMGGQEWTEKKVAETLGEGWQNVE